MEIYSIKLNVKKWINSGKLCISNKEKAAVLNIYYAYKTSDKRSVCYVQYIFVMFPAPKTTIICQVTSPAPLTLYKSFSMTLRTNENNFITIRCHVLHQYLKVFA